MREIQIIDAFIPQINSYSFLASNLKFHSFHFEKCSFHGISVTPTDGPVPELIKQVFPKAEPTLSFFRQSPEGQVEPHFIHTDVDMGDWSAILYLNEDPPESDGTCFWTYVKTGAIESLIPHERSEEGTSSAGWALRKFVPAKMNRLLVFPSSFFHSRAMHENWGEGVDSRLTQVTFGKGDIFT